MTSRPRSERCSLGGLLFAAVVLYVLPFVCMISALKAGSLLLFPLFRLEKE